MLDWVKIRSCFGSNGHKNCKLYLRKPSMGTCDIEQCGLLVCSVFIRFVIEVGLRCLVCHLDHYLAKVRPLGEILERLLGLLKLEHLVHHGPDPLLFVEPQHLLEPVPGPV